MTSPEPPMLKLADWTSSAASRIDPEPPTSAANAGTLIRSTVTVPEPPTLTPRTIGTVTATRTVPLSCQSQLQLTPRLLPICSVPSTTRISSRSSAFCSPMARTLGVRPVTTVTSGEPLSDIRSKPPTVKFNSAAIAGMANNTKIGAAYRILAGSCVMVT
jgi:hypothetical protein